MKINVMIKCLLNVFYKKPKELNLTLQPVPGVQLGSEFPQAAAGARRPGEAQIRLWAGAALAGAVAGGGAGAGKSRLSWSLSH